MELPEAPSPPMIVRFATEKKGAREVDRKGRAWDFPGGPVVKTPHSQCRGLGFDPWSGN